jgi:hypothetical protein
MDRGFHDRLVVQTQVDHRRSRRSRNLSLISSVWLEISAWMVIDTIFCAAPSAGVSVRTALFSFEGTNLIAKFDV